MYDHEAAYTKERDTPTLIEETKGCHLISRSRVFVCLVRTRIWNTCVDRFIDESESERQSIGGTSMLSSTYSIFKIKNQSCHTDKQEWKGNERSGSCEYLDLTQKRAREKERDKVTVHSSTWKNRRDDKNNREQGEWNNNWRERKERTTRTREASPSTIVHVRRGTHVRMLLGLCARVRS